MRAWVNSTGGPRFDTFSAPAGIGLKGRLFEQCDPEFIFTQHEGL